MSRATLVSLFKQRLLDAAAGLTILKSVPTPTHISCEDVHSKKLRYNVKTFQYL